MRHGWKKFWRCGSAAAAAMAMLALGLASASGQKAPSSERHNKISTVTVSALGSPSADCVSRNERRLRASIKTGRGLELGDACARATELYGTPESHGPSVRGSRKLELLSYSFDWAGEDVPQSMEVSCDAESERVVEITLASASL